jgi:enamine deaminase RidA (YjgF/YER057c/UK114 family)
MRTLISSGSSFEHEIGYSRAVVADGWIFVSGTTGFDYTTARPNNALSTLARHLRKPAPSSPTS